MIGVVDGVPVRAGWFCDRDGLVYLLDEHGVLWDSRHQPCHPNYAATRAPFEELGRMSQVEEAWDEGYESGCEDRYGTSTPGGQPYDPTPNPYRVTPAAGKLQL